ncbi:N-acetyl-D-Glu racemase DgcA [Henriciella sp.]|uniref:N-acetyl-D-Glu racemase DgcA n=1 Tax=Henriciella sp. TaxID=1968823 RepID=UPI00262AB363|nr:N-acetyl-D-Glu racemase DgcA [Henriciella sp.]
MLRTTRSRIEKFALHTPFRIARGTKTAAEVVSVTIVQNGIEGRGEAVPYARYGETLQSVSDQIAGLAPELDRGMGRDGLLAALPAGAARNAIDCALWDLEARLDSPAPTTPHTEPVITAVTVGVDTPENMARAAAILANVPLLKIKLNEDNPQACLEAVRKAAPDPQLIVDPNESWDFDILQSLQEPMAELDVAFVEQPLPAGADDCLAGLDRAVPVCADESCHTSQDLSHLSGLYDIINIKLDKTGGLTEALALYEAGRARNFGIMVGCMISSSLSIAPALKVARHADYVDLDGPAWLADDRENGVAIECGMIHPPPADFWAALTPPLPVPPVRRNDQIGKFALRRTRP